MFSLSRQASSMETAKHDKPKTFARVKPVTNVELDALQRTSSSTIYHWFPAWSDPVRRMRKVRLNAIASRNTKLKSRPLTKLQDIDKYLWGNVFINIKRDKVVSKDPSMVARYPSTYCTIQSNHKHSSGILAFK